MVSPRLFVCTRSIIFTRAHAHDSFHSALVLSDQWLRSKRTTATTTPTLPECIHVLHISGFSKNENLNNSFVSKPISKFFEFFLPPFENFLKSTRLTKFNQI